MPKFQKNFWMGSWSLCIMKILYHRTYSSSPTSSSLSASASRFLQVLHPTCPRKEAGNILIKDWRPLSPDRETGDLSLQTMSPHSIFINIKMVKIKHFYLDNRKYGEDEKYVPTTPIHVKQRNNWWCSWRYGRWKMWEGMMLTFRRVNWPKYLYTTNWAKMT